MQKLWIYLGSIPVVFVLAIGTLQVVGVLAHEEVTETATFAAEEVRGLRVDNENGPVEITGGDVEQITVVAEISRGLRRTRSRVEVVDGVLELDADCPMMPIWCEVAYTVTVPADLPVTADVDHGDLVLRDLTGAVTADGGNGPVDLIRLAGILRVRTDSGSITGIDLRSAIVEADSGNGRVELTFADAPEFVTATTDNGSVAVEVPEGDAAYRVDARTDSGSTDVGVRTDPAGERSITTYTGNGSVSVRYR